nr:ubiquitin-associated domain-containing protein 2-like [Penaeus vannamei]
MATILSQYSTTGFYNAPVSKGLMGCMFLTCTALNVPLFAHLRKYLICKIPDVFLKGEIWRIASAKISFVDTKDLVCGSLLIYYFRVFERRYGSHKFASCLVASQVLTTVLEVLTILTLQWLAIDLHSGGFLPPGPYGMIFPLFVNYLFDIPRVAQTSVLGIPITGKTLTYLLGLQVCSTSPATATSALCGIIAGVLYRYKYFCIYSANECAPCGCPGPWGLVRCQAHSSGYTTKKIAQPNRPGANGAVPPFMQNFIGRRQNNPVHPPPPPTEEQVQTLVEMGFDRQRVINALQTCNNDVNTATHLLLQES